RRGDRVRLRRAGSARSGRELRGRSQRGIEVPPLDRTGAERDTDSGAGRGGARRSHRAAHVLAGRSAHALLRGQQTLQDQGRWSELAGDQSRPGARGPRRPDERRGAASARRRAPARRDLRSRRLALEPRHALGRDRRRTRVADAKRRRPLGERDSAGYGCVEQGHPDRGFALRRGTAYVSVSRLRIDDLHPYLFRTRDGGRTWEAIAGALPADAPVNSVREDPQRQGLLYAATEKAVWISDDDGEHWDSLQLNLPHTSMRDLW